jgi:hypothetical protein
MPSDPHPPDPPPRTARRRLARWLDRLCQGTPPPGLIDIVHTRHAHLHRRFTMIASFDGKAGRWSATSFLVSIVLGGVALTGAVRGQDAAAPPAAEPAQPAPREVKAAPAGYPGSVDASPESKVDPKTAEKLWNEKYAKMIVYVDGQEVNREAVDQAYLAELQQLAAGKATSGEIRKADVTRLDPGAAAKIWMSKYAPKIFYVNGQPVNKQKLEEQFVDELAPLAGSREAAEQALAGLLRTRAALGDAQAIQELWEKEYRPRLRMVDGKPINRQDVEAQFKVDLARLERQVRSDSPVAAAAPAGGARVAPPGAAPAPEEPGVKDEDVDQGLLATLERKVPETNFDGAAFTDVVDFLRDASGANIIVEWKALEAAGIDRNAPVSLRLRNVKFGRVLDLVLSNVGGATVPVGYSVSDNILRVSTLEDLDRVTDVRAYDVRDIVPAELTMEELAKMIVDTVATDSWRDSGGSTGGLRVSKHKLIVTQTPNNHRQIRAVLKMLREQPHDAAAAAPAAGGRQ